MAGRSVSACSWGSSRSSSGVAASSVVALAPAVVEDDGDFAGVVEGGPALLAHGFDGGCGDFLAPGFQGFGVGVADAAAVGVGDFGALGDGGAEDVDDQLRGWWGGGVVVVVLEAWTGDFWGQHEWWWSCRARNFA